jgi:hypothetical protein
LQNGANDGTDVCQDGVLSRRNKGLAKRDDSLLCRKVKGQSREDEGWPGRGEKLGLETNPEAPEAVVGQQEVHNEEMNVDIGAQYGDRRTMLLTAKKRAQGNSGFRKKLAAS